MLFGKITTKIYNMRANNAFRTGNIPETLSWLDKSYKTGRADPKVVTTYGYMLLKYGHLNEAEKILKEQLAAPNLPNNAYYDAKSNYALVLWKQGQLDKAIAMFEDILPNFKNTNVYGSLGYLYILQGDLEKALKFNLEAYEYNRTGGVILDNLGQTYYLAGDNENAEKTFKALMDLNPKFPEAYYDYALVCEKAGNMEKCKEMLKNALKYDTNYLSVITTEDIENKLKELDNIE